MGVTRACPDECLFEDALYGKHFRNTSLSVVVDDRLYIALFSAVAQTHCARMRFFKSD